MIGVIFSVTSKLNVPYVLLIIGVIAPVVSSWGMCFTQSCREATAVYVRTTGGSRVSPCRDFFSYVCGGWLETVYRKDENSTKSLRMGTVIRMKAAVREIFKRQAVRILDVSKNASRSEFLNSDIQCAHLNKSCLRAREGDY